MGSARTPGAFQHHDLTPGGTITYFISRPDGADRFDGTRKVVEVDAPKPGPFVPRVCGRTSGGPPDAAPSHVAEAVRARARHVAAQDPTTVQDDGDSRP